MKVLVAYASRHGATQGIAERIAQTLSGSGLEVTIQRADQAQASEAYDAFVIGSGAYAGHWVGAASNFVRRNRTLLEKRPVWLFSSGPVGPDKVDKSGRDVTETARPKEFAEFAGAIHPRDEHVFFGAYDPDLPPTGLDERLMKGFMKLMPSVRNALPAGDFRDWPAIEAWAKGIAQELTPAWS
jgi:menaquinone-dependent protoporphyrinogen oxidase